MRMRMNKYLIFAVALSVMLGGNLNAQSTSASNLVSNGDFEKAGANSSVDGWKSEGEGAISLDSEVKNAGKSALKITLEKKGNVTAECQRFSVIPGSQYLLSGWLRTEGFGPGSHQGVDASLALLFFSNDKMTPRPDMLGCDPWTIGFPYGDVITWRSFTRLVTVPADATEAVIRISINSSKDKQTSICRIDNLRLSAYAPPKADGKAWVYEIGEKMALASAEKIDDPDATNGKAVRSMKDVQKPGTIVFGPYTKDQTAGQYRISVRAKVDDNTAATPVFVMLLQANENIGSMTNILVVKGTDFKAPNSYQEFEFEGVKPPAGNFEFPIYWSGKTNLWLDRITVTTEKTFTPEETAAFWQ